MRANPLREHTNQMLPGNPGMFEPYSARGITTCKIGKRKYIETIALGGPFAGKFHELQRTTDSIKLPDGTEVDIKKIGKGHASVAYQGKDGWVYVVTSDSSGDKSKSILSEFYPSKSATKHIPYVESVGRIVKRGGSGFEVYRMPFYRRINSKDKSYKLAEKIYGALLESEKTRTRVTSSNKYEPQVSHFATYLENNPPEGVPASVVDAMIELCSHLSNYEGDFRLEFPNQNVAVDADGNIVFLDVFFDYEEYRKKHHIQNARVLPV